MTKDEEIELKKLELKDKLSNSEEERFQILTMKYVSARESEFIDLFIRPFLPEFRLGSSFRMGTFKSNHKGAEWDVSPSNEIFRDSNYYFNPSKSQRLVHFTSLKNLKSILKSQCLWLRPLDAMEDPNEMFTLAQDLGFSKSEISDYQEDFYSVSFNLFENSESEEWIYWKMYGKERNDPEGGTGAALEFTLEEQDVSKWNTFHCSKIHYGFDEEIKILKGIREKAFAWMDINEFRVKNLSEIYLKIMAFHKNEMWKFGNEIRILFNDGDGLSKNYLNKVQEDEFGRRVELQIGNRLKNLNNEYIEKGFQEVVHFKPQLKLSSIILGPKIKDFDAKKLELDSELKNNFPYPVEVRKSKFYDYFTGKRY